MARDNQSDRGTFKKSKEGGRMNLSSNTLYEFDLNELTEDELVFFLGGITDQY